MMLRKLILIFIILLIICSSFANKELENSLQVAQKYIVLQKYEEAQSILELLYLDYTDDLRVNASLKEVYFATSQYEKLKNLLLNQSSREPRNANVLIDLGKLELVQGNANEAMKYYTDAFELYPNNEMYYQKSLEEYLQKGYTEEAKKIVDIARDNLDNDNAFAMNMAMAYEIDGDFDRAMEEYGKYISVYPDRFRDVERRIDLAGRTEEEIQDLEKSIHKMFDKGRLSKDKIYQLLARLNQRLYNYDDALTNLIKAEETSNNNKPGSLIYPFGMRMNKDGYFEVSVQAGDYLINNAADDRIAERGKLIKAEALFRLGKIEDAYTLYNDMISTKTVDIKLKAMLGKATIDLETGNYKDGRKTLDEIVKIRNSATQSIALKMYALSYIETNELGLAKDILEKYANSFKNEGWYLFILGEVLLFEKDYENAEKLFRSMVGKASEDLDGNDAVEYLLLMTNKDDPAFEKYISAKRAMKTFDFEQADKIFSDIISGDSKLKINALWELANLEYSNDNFDNAKNHFLMITDEFPQSFYAPLSLEFLGDISNSQKKPDEAYKYFEKVILEYEDAINITRVREKARKVSEL